MSSSPKKTTESDAAEWLCAEISALARSAGADSKTCGELGETTRKLARGIGESRETHLRIDAESERSFLRAAAAAFPLNAVAGTPKTFSEGKTTPLVFDEKNSALYFFRHYKQEIQTAEKIIALTDCAAETRSRGISESAEKILAAEIPFQLNAEQREAVRAILAAPLSVVSGGPGTGKTTLLLRALLCIFSENPDAEVILAAPTGKAAARMKESVRSQADEIAASASARQTFPPSALERARNLVPATLHRILRVGASSLKTLPPPAITADYVIIDESSMLDQALTHRLLRALSRRSRLVLLGDGNQLDSVGAGHVFGALCKAERLRPFRTELTASRRFTESGVLGKLARAVVSGDVPAARKLLRETPDDPRSREIFRFSSEKISARSIDDALRALFPEKLRSVPADADPEETLAQLETARLLTPLRGGEFGAEAINARARALFAGTGNPDARAHYHGQPIIITRNAPQERLFNGDTGVVLREKSAGTLFAYFRNDDGALRRIPAALLPEHETAYAMSIHKAQGSEFSRLCVIFPAAGTRAEFFSRQLLYTAVSRFRESGNAPYFHLIFDEETLLAAVGRESPLLSLLPARLDEKTGAGDK